MPIVDIERVRGNDARPGSLREVPTGRRDGPVADGMVATTYDRLGTDETRE